MTKIEKIEYAKSFIDKLANMKNLSPFYTMNRYNNLSMII